MCNLYSITRSQEAMRRLLGISRDLAGNLPSLPDVFPDQMAPIVELSFGSIDPPLAPRVWDTA